MIGTSWKMGLVKFFVYGATFCCKIIIMKMIMIMIMIMIMKITIAIINRSEDLKLRNTDINQWSSI